MFFFFKQKTAYEMRISDWSSDVCSSDLAQRGARELALEHHVRRHREDPDQRGGDEAKDRQVVDDQAEEAVEVAGDEPAGLFVCHPPHPLPHRMLFPLDRKSTRLNSSH